MTLSRKSNWTKIKGKRLQFLYAYFKSRRSLKTSTFKHATFFCETLQSLLFFLIGILTMAHQILYDKVFADFVYCHILFRALCFLSVSSRLLFSPWPFEVCLSSQHSPLPFNLYKCIYFCKIIIYRY